MADSAALNSLLRWSIENMDASTRPEDQASRPPPQPIDPEIIDMILGKPDSVRMKVCLRSFQRRYMVLTFYQKEQLKAATDITKDEEDRLIALDNFEMAGNLKRHLPSY